MSLMISFLLTGCQDNNELDNSGRSFGFFQLKLSKKELTRGIIQGGELENLKDAKKIQIDLLYNNRQVSQTLNLLSVDENAAEFGLTTETIELLAGDYTLTGYKIYGAYTEGTSEDNKAPILQVGEPDELTQFRIEDSQLYIQHLAIEAQLKGNLSFYIGKDFTNIQPEMKASFNPDDFQYGQIAKVQLDLKRGTSGTPRQYEFKAYRGPKDYLFHTDTLALRAGDYQTTQMRLYDQKDKLIMVVDKSQTIKIADQKMSRDTINIDMPLTPAFKDYIALYNIWKAMDGENWYWQGMGYNAGANWVFTYSDGSHRPLDLWGNQPGVGIASKGRVTNLNLGAFNPKGVVPDAIGDLTELQILYLGNHNDVDFIDPEVGTAGIDKWFLLINGVDLSAERMNIAKEQLRIRHPKAQSTLNYGTKKPFVYATDAVKYGNVSNRISGISEAIANCKELTQLSIANGMISELPASLATLPNLTDVEIFNSPVTEIPAAITQLPNLILLNFSANLNVDQNPLQASLRALCDGPSKDKLQILYMNELKLTELPSNLSNLEHLGLLDVGTNRIKQLPMLGQKVALVQCFLDNNLIESIPDKWFMPDDLETMTVSNNKLTEFPNMFSSKSMYKVSGLDFSGNQISKFSANFEGVNVEVLNLNNNSFTELPVELSDTESKFNFLQVSNNRIDTIKPDALKNLKYLEALECMGNNLKSMPLEFNTEVFPYLNGIDISYNHFSRFPEHILNVTALGQLRISNQYDPKTGRRTLTDWPENLFKHPGLRVLDIHGNNIHNVRNFPMLLNYLDIHDNPNIYISVPADIAFRIMSGTFKLICDREQNIEGIDGLK